MNVVAYKRTISETEAPRQIERRLLSQVNAELERSFAAFDQTDDRLERLQLLASGLRHVLWKNERIWMTFKMDLSDPGNVMNDQLRAALISVAIWVENHTQAVMAGARQIRPLIDVNRSIILGLAGQTTEAPG